MKMDVLLADKPWGQVGVANPLHTGGDPSRRVGEVSFAHPGRAELPVLIKYLYTTERLSIQVHPNNDEAQRRGHPCGKDEMWVVLKAAPHSTIGLGLTRPADTAELNRAVLDGSIEQLVDWRPVKAGDVIYNSAGTIHAAGADLVLLEVQQSIDLTYRLYDYGRPRELHLAEGLAVARGRPHYDPRDCSVADGRSRILADGPYFGAAWCVGGLPTGLPFSAAHWQLVVVEGHANVGTSRIEAGECCLLSSPGEVSMTDETVAVLAWPIPEALAEAA